MTAPSIEAAVADAGLYIAGSFTLTAEEIRIFGTSGASALLVGNAGPALWRLFTEEQGEDGKPDPLNRWTRRRLDRIAGQTGADVIYPFDGPPWPPFGQWALRTGQFFESPLGLKIHPRFGLWQAFRGVLVLSDEVQIPTGAPARSPCDDCVDKPCLTTCPVGAFSPGYYDVPVCRDHISNAGAECLNRGCLARHACPVGRGAAYAPEQAAFHMRSFLTV
tara:strand:- start:1103 stop:1762 length:660 start_codon:yes stop_codon:yes gene_type:complete